MKKKHINILSTMIPLLVILGLFSCSKKNYLENPEGDEIYSVQFKVNRFVSKITSIPNKTMAINKYSASNSPTEEVLYNWNFDNDNTIATIAFNQPYNIESNNGQTNFTYSAGYPSSGRALTVKSTPHVYVKIKNTNINQYTKLSFDCNSSGTGPRAFVISYSKNNGTSYEQIADTLRIPSANGTTTKYSVELNLSELTTNQADDLWLRISLFEGSRAGVSAYNPNVGTFKLDNLSIYGIKVPGSQSMASDKTYYHLFNGTTQVFIQNGLVDNNNSITFELPAGKYILNITTKNHNTSPVFAQANNGFNQFSITDPEIISNREWYGRAVNFTVTDDKSQEISLVRLYSEIKFNLTDQADLSHIDSIQIKQLHLKPVYLPATNDHNSTEADNKILTIKPTFTQTNKSFTFNQYLGILANNKTVKYQISVFKEGNMIKTFEVESSIKNNMRLTFEGELLAGVNAVNGFNIIKDENWDNAVTSTF